MSSGWETSHLPPEQGLEIGQLHSQGGTWSTRPALLRQFSGAWELVFLVTERPGLYQGKQTQGSSSPCQGWAHSWPAGAAHISLFRLMTSEGHSSFRTVQKLHQVPLWFCLTAGESSPIPKECEDRHQRAGSGMHFPPRKAERVGEDAAPAKPHCTCGLHHHGHDMVYSVASARGMCSQLGPLGAPIIQVTKGSPCTRNTRALFVSKPKPSRSFHYQYSNPEKMAVTVLYITGIPHPARHRVIWVLLSTMARSETWQWWADSSSTEALFLSSTTSPHSHKHITMWQAMLMLPLISSSVTEKVGFRLTLSYCSCFQIMMKADI